jgi:signal transduction histidine kinase
LPVHAREYRDASLQRLKEEISETAGKIESETQKYISKRYGTDSYVFWNRLTALFRVIQQSLANIHRHSGSQAARIVLDLTPECVTLEISDQGTGIAAKTLADFHSGTRLPGVGMVGMRERVLNMDGQFHVASSDQGTRLQISLPLPANAQSASA